MGSDTGKARAVAGADVSLPEIPDQDGRDHCLRQQDTMKGHWTCEVTRTPRGSGAGGRE